MRRHSWDTANVCRRCGLERTGSYYSGKVGGASRYYRRGDDRARVLVACGPGAHEAPTVPRGVPPCIAALPARPSTPAAEGEPNA